ncbi:VOC family protein [Tenacibaculum jejuense]|uniref:VOC domain-containing protein n=1 Tax=Tenacibaculum jejuense TaxID=584609 RepID=A0A238U6K7_9FLAO|nr:glyoxalase [Tenacibaculum jejuense]SNR14695.1 conserved protein of unknown function [Tenacibaculum jejuense]
MKFLQLKLYTNKLESELLFYSETLGFEIVHQSKNSFSVKVGWSELIFEKSEQKHQYHYCFLIPSNHLYQALEWMEKRTEIITIEENKKTQNFKSWNADSFYFLDASENVVEFIVRHNLKNEETSAFNLSKVIGVNEMGMPTKYVSKINDQLEKELNTKFWKGDIERFGTNGDEDGILLLPNYEIKKHWFPTNSPIKAQPFETIVEHKETIYKLVYQNEVLHTKKLTAE